MMGTGGNGITPVQTAPRNSIFRQLQGHQKCCWFLVFGKIERTIPWMPRFVLFIWFIAHLSSKDHRMVHSIKTQKHITSTVHNAVCKESRESNALDTMKLLAGRPLLHLKAHNRVLSSAKLSPCCARLWPSRRCIFLQQQNIESCCILSWTIIPFSSVLRTLSCSRRFPGRDLSQFYLKMLGNWESRQPLWHQ